MSVRKQFNTVDDIKLANKNAGSHFFDPSTLGWWKSIVYDDLHCGVFFITSEQDDEKQRHWTIRQVGDNPRHIITVGTFDQYNSLYDARAALSKLTLDDAVSEETYS